MIRITRAIIEVHWWECFQREERDRCVFVRSFFRGEIIIKFVFLLAIDVDADGFRSINLQCGDEFDEDASPYDVRLSCFAHTLQLCIRDGLKNATCVPKLLSKCKALAKFSHRSCKAADLFEQINKHIHKSNATRWNSEFMLIKSIVSLGKDDLDVIVSSMENPIKFSNSDFVLLGEMIEILGPFCEISIKCQADTVVTASLVVPSIVHLLSHLRDMKEGVKFCAKLIQQLQGSIAKRFSGITDRLQLVDVAASAPYGDPLYFIAAVLDPSFKFYWIKDLQLSPHGENCLKQNVIRLIIDEVNNDLNTYSVALNKSSDSSSSSSSTASSSLSSTPKPKRRRLFQYEDGTDTAIDETTALDPAVELDAFLSDPVRTRFSDYWFKSPLNILKKLVKRVFTVQASSAPIERVFSHAGLIYSPRRTNIGTDLFRDLVFLRVNQNLL
jgi:zinc finger BED domain-containing protein 4